MIPPRSEAIIRVLVPKARKPKGRLGFSGRQRRRWPRALFLTATAFIASLLPAGIPAGSRTAESRAARPPVSRTRSIQLESSPLSETLRALKRGVDSYDGKRYAPALEILPDEEAAKTNLLGDYILLYRARSNSMIGRTGEALNGFRLLESRFPDSPLLQDALTDQGEALLKLGDPRAALKVLSAPGFEQNAATLYLKAKAHREVNEREAAIQLFLQIYSQYPASQASQLAEGDLRSLSPSALSGGRNYGLRLLRAENLLKAGDNLKARSLLSVLGRVSAPDRSSSEKRSLLLAEAEYRLGRASTALTHLRKVTNTDSELHAKAVYLEGACYRRLKREAALLSARNRALKLHPLSPHTEELCYSAATYFELNYESGKAREAYRILYQAFPNGKRAERAHWQTAMYAYLAKEYGDAALGFWKYVLAYPNALPASSAMYWMGRCYEKLGDSAGAKYLFTRAQALGNEGYYGQRARESAGAPKNLEDSRTAAIPGIDFNQVTRTCDRIQHPPVTIPRPGADSARTVERASALVTADLPEFALSELRWRSRRHPQEEDALGYLMSEINESMEDHLGAIGCLRKIFPDYISRPQDALPDEVWRMLFPLRHWRTVSDQADRNQTDPALILGVIRQESGFKEKAQSKANARGLMQILPSTGRRLARQAGIKRYNAGKLFDAEISITLGTRYLASLLTRYGDHELALAAYNAGGSRVDRWLKEFGKGDLAEFVERIPFGETRNYVKQVLSNRARYALLIPSALSAAR